MIGASRIGLGMVVKDGEAHVERCIRSALPLIDRYTIIDTGSTDRTKEIVQETLAHLPGQLLEAPWVGHAHNRSELLKIARHGCDYVLMLDHDMEVVVEGDIPELTEPAYLLTVRDRGMEYPLPLLTRTDKPWYYAGVAHCYLACAEEGVEGKWLREIALVDHGGGSSQSTGKIERDRDALAAEVGRDPTDRRSWFYLAQSYRDLDQVDEAIAAYRFRASLGGWDEEVYYSRYQAGVLLCEHRDAREGMKLLLEAWVGKQDRTEALRALSNVARNVADKVLYPENDVLFVQRAAYAKPAPSDDKPLELPPLSALKPKLRRRPRVTKLRGLDPRDVTAILVTRGDHPAEVAETAASLPYGEVIVWDNSKREHDYKVFGRYAAIPEAHNPVLFWLDDDVVFTAHKELLQAYEPGVLVSNMDEAWIDGAGYGDFLGMVGTGSLCDSNLPAEVFAHYLARYPFDDDVLLEADFCFGVLAPFKRVDLGYDVRAFTDDADRLYLQPGQTERKWAMIARCRDMVRMGSCTEGVAA